ncbi:hypothetical protein [Nocardioides okcheonensis]|uniref:hypothetical protein n=1 Tax=Nocardioides okcheonensis TaxID=2894081 RepID=UPI001E5C76D2|nr:hypothetical protein [Nocardioides okcheonensis]UFN45253.1 hypothetical protein LN652_03290 [Nocardioides okcheonensis]
MDEGVVDAPAPPDVEPTGVDAVDRVLAEVDGLADRPVAEHVAVFEAAHERLRRALDAAPAADQRGA